MNQLTCENHQSIRDLIAARRPGYSLPRPFYHDPSIYRAEIDGIWRRGWLFAGHTCQLPEAGDYFTYEVDTDSLVIIRDDIRDGEGRIRALHNVCRHRGSRICGEQAGHAGKLVCPYHQWVYGRDGRLLSMRGMHEEVDPSQLGLHEAHVRELAGLIYVSLAEEPPDFQPAADCMAPQAASQGFERAKVAKIVDYDVGANWKLVWENNRECYHCNVRHPQYIRANYDHYNEDDTTEAIREEMRAFVERSEAKWAAAGLAVTHTESGMATFPDAEADLWYSANRTVLTPGYLSETMDGRQVAPLMGEYTDADVGTLRMRTVPNFWNHSSCDHGVSTRLTPMGTDRTQVRVIWVVDAAAEEGRDYELSDVMPFWQLTSEQDWNICENQQRGVTSRAYEPGPLSTYKEYNVESFLQWYLKRLGEAVDIRNTE
jgi:Rieske 2Fe-2S family protein